MDLNAFVFVVLSVTEILFALQATAAKKSRYAICLYASLTSHLHSHFTLVITYIL